MKLVFLGAPGAGKGTHAGFVQQMLDVPVLSVGNILREAIRQGTPLGKQVKEIMDSGSLVPDEITIGLIRDKLHEPECEQGVIIDGFPRTLAQAKALDEICEIDAVISLEVPDAVIEQRMAGRRICPKCQRPYHITSNPPQVEGMCDVCGAQLVIRDDDKPEVLANRFIVYHELTEPIKEYYQSRGKLRPVNGLESVDDTRRAVMQALGLGL